MESVRASGELHLVALVGLAVLLPTLVACGARPPHVAPMVPRGPDVVFPSTNTSVAVGEVETFGEADMVNLAEINVDSVRVALILALEASGLFDTVLAVPDPGADYELSAVLLTQDQTGSLSATSRALIRYILRDARTSEVVYEKDVRSSSTAGVGDAFSGTTRMRKASEGAVRESFRLLLADLAALPLGTPRISFVEPARVRR